MPIVLVSDVNRPLTVLEFDGNFTTLKGMIDYLTDHPLQGVGVSSITQDGTAGPITFHMSDGTARGPFTLPKSNFRYRGDWAALTNYIVGDFFAIADVGLYVVLQTHTSAATFDPARQIGGDDVYALAIPYLANPPTWIEIEADTAGGLAIDLSLGDKFRAYIMGDTEILFPTNIPSYMPPFVLDLIMVYDATITFDAGYIGDDPSLIMSAGDRNIVSGIVLDETNAILSTVKQIPA